MNDKSILFIAIKKTQKNTKNEHKDHYKVLIKNDEIGVDFQI